MFETHTNKDGTILICQMDDRHLANTIKAFCREIEKCRKLATQPTAENQLIAIFNSSFSQDNVKAEAEKQLKSLHQRLQPYLGEALLRGLDLSKELKIAYGRLGQVKNSFSVTLELSSEDEWDRSHQEYLRNKAKFAAADIQAWKEGQYEDDYSDPGHPSHYGDR